MSEEEEEIEAPQVKSFKCRIELLQFRTNQNTLPRCSIIAIFELVVR